MKKSLSVKLFTTILFTYLIVVIGIVFTLDIYFNVFFEQIKINKTIDSINTFTNNYRNQQWNRDELYQQINVFNSTNNVIMSVSTEETSEGSEEGKEGEEAEDHNENESNLVLITAKDSKLKYYDFFVTSDNFENLKLAKDSRIELVGYHKDSGVIVPISINNSVINTVDINSNNVFQKSVVIVGIKTNLALPNNLQNNGPDYQVLKSKTINDVYYSISQLKSTNIRQITFIRSVKDSENQKSTFTVKYSLQPISETLAVIKNFFPYFIILSLIISAIIGLIYSLSVTKPIIKITNVADDMAKMDFTKKLDTSRQDELGKLSSSLNSLSSNLESALNRLKVANIKLKEDYDKEVKQELARKEFIANASHELKTPLGIIEGYAEGIRDCINEEEKDEYLEVITDEIKKMDNLIQEMLKISKYDSMAIKINKEPIEILDIIYEEVQAFEKPLAHKKMLVDITGDFGVCNIDKKQIQSAFINLFSNAVKYANKNSTITIKGTNLKTSIKIEIANDCKPFSESEMKKIWDRFYKLDNNCNISGTGLGLAIVKSIFEAHNLKYGVFNSDSGVVFWFEVEK